MSRRPADKRTKAFGIMIRAVAIVRTMSRLSTASWSASGVPLTRTSMLIGTLSGWDGHIGERAEQARAIIDRLAHADDTTAAHVDPGITYRVERVESILVSTCRYDIAVELWGGVEVVVVIIKAGLLEFCGLLRSQHPQCHTAFHPEIPDRMNQRDHALEIAVFGRTPGGAHAEPGRAGITGVAGCLPTVSTSRRSLAETFVSNRALWDSSRNLPDNRRS